MVSGHKKHSNCQVAGGVAVGSTESDAPVNTSDGNGAPLNVPLIPASAERNFVFKRGSITVWSVPLLYGLRDIVPRPPTGALPLDHTGGLPIQKSYVGKMIARTSFFTAPSFLEIERRASM